MICTDIFGERAFPFACPSSSSVSFRSFDLVLLIFYCVIRIISRSYQSSWEAREKIKFLVILQIRLKKKSENNKKFCAVLCRNAHFIDARLLIMNVHTYCGWQSGFPFSDYWWLVQRIRHKKRVCATERMNQIAITLDWFHLALSKTKNCQCKCNILMINY